MKVITFRAICRDHDLDKTFHLKGAATLRQVDRGYEMVDREMQKHGCTDFDVTYSIVSVVKGHKMPA